MTQTLRSSAECNARLGAIGVLLAAGRLTPIKGAKQLEEEETALKIELIEAYQREGEEARDRAEIAARTETARQKKLADARELRIAKSVADASR